MTRIRITGPRCRHNPTGRVAWPTGKPEHDQPHASTYCCDRAECRDDAAAWVESVTRVRGVFVPFEEVEHR